MANKIMSQLLLVALAVPQVICTNTSQSDYASFYEHVQTDCFKGGPWTGDFAGAFKSTGIDVEANPPSACKTCSGSGPQHCLTCDKGSTLWFIGKDCSGICASDPTGSTVGEGNLFGALELGSIAFTNGQAYMFLGEHSFWKDKSCCTQGWKDKTCCRHGMDVNELTCKPKGCKNVPSAYYYPAHSKDPYEKCGGEFDSEVEVRMYSRASGSEPEYEGVEIVTSLDDCPKGKICNPYGIRRYSKGMPATLTRTSARRRRSKSKDDDSDDDKSKSDDNDNDNDNDDNDNPDSSEERQDCGACKKECKKNGGSRCGKTDCKNVCRPDDDDKSKSKSKDDDSDDDKSKSKSKGKSKSNSKSKDKSKDKSKSKSKDKSKSKSKDDDKSKSKSNSKDDDSDDDKSKSKSSLVEVIQDKDSSDGTGKSKGLMRRSGRKKGKIATAIESEGEVGSSQS